MMRRCQTVIIASSWWRRDVCFFFLRGRKQLGNWWAASGPASSSCTGIVVVETGQNSKRPALVGISTSTPIVISRRIFGIFYLFIYPDFKSTLWKKALPAQGNPACSHNDTPFLKIKF
jgi:hypothetical protein